MTLTGNIGIDRFQQDRQLFFPRELHFEPLDGLLGTAIRGVANSRQINWDVNFIYSRVPTSETWRSVATMGLHYDQSMLDIVWVSGKDLGAGLNNLGAARSLIAEKYRQSEQDQSVSVQEELLLLDDRLSLLAAMLAERNILNGDPSRFFLYPKASIAYRILTKRAPQIDLLHLRVAYGESGNNPQYGYKFSSPVMRTTIGGNAGLTFGSRAPNPALKPERLREFETGFDLSFFEGRSLVELTLYQSRLQDVILHRQLAPSTGFTSQIANTDTWLRNHGIELLLQVTPVRTSEVQWRSRILFSLNRSKVARLGVPAYHNIGSFGGSLGTFRLEEGQSVTQIVGDSPDSDTPVKVGDTEPDFLMSFVQDFTYKGFRLYALLDWQQGSDIINLNRLLYDYGAVSPDYTEPMGGQYRLVNWLNGDTSVYIEDGSFLKLREVSLSYAIPRQYLEQIGGMHSATIAMSARNLLTFTGYSGLDPEVGSSGGQTIERNIDVAPYPPSRSFWVSIEASF